MKKIATPFVILVLLTFQTYAQWTVFNSSNSGLSSNTTWFVIKDNYNNIWTSTVGGLNKFNVSSNTWTSYTTSNSGIGNNDIHGIVIDNSGAIWVGTYGGGISSFNGSIWTNYNSWNSPLPVNEIYHLTYDGTTNTLWASTRYGGLVNYNITTSSWTVFDWSDGLLDDVIDDVDIAPNGDVWIACRYAGVAVYNGSFHYYTVANCGIAGDDIYSISVDNNGKVWAGATTGLSVYDGLNWTNYTTTNSSITGNYIRHIEFDNFGNAWVSTGGGGILKFNGTTTWTSYNTTNSNIPSNMIWSAFLTTDNSILISTWTGGIARMDSLQTPDTIATRIAYFPVVPPTVFTGLNEQNEEESGIAFYPDPVSDVMMIKNKNIRSVEIYDATSRKVYAAPVQNKVALDFLETGFYSISFFDKQHYRIGTSKFLKK